MTREIDFVKEQISEVWRETTPCTRISIIHDDPRGSQLSGTLHTRYIVVPCKAETLRGLCLPFVSFCSLSRANNDRLWSYSRTSEACFACASEISQNYAVISGGDVNTRTYTRTLRAPTHPHARSPGSVTCATVGVGYEDMRAPLGIFASSFSLSSYAEHFHKLPHKAYSHIPSCASPSGAKWIRFGINYAWMDLRERMDSVNFPPTILKFQQVEGSGLAKSEGWRWNAKVRQKLHLEWTAIWQLPISSAFSRLSFVSFLIFVFIYKKLTL